MKNALLDPDTIGEFTSAFKNHGSFSQVLEQLPTIQVDDETLYRVEGDLLMDEDQLAQYLLRKSLTDQEQLGVDTALVGIVANGQIVRWSPGTVLRYAVIKSSFVGGDAEYNLAVSCVREAAIGWENTCGVKFEHVVSLDTSPPTPVPNGVVFSVRGFDSGGRFIAAAFFPNDPLNRRRLLIDPTFFSMQPPPAGFSRVGVLRHEMGHILGFRHEHIRSGAPASCPDEPLFGTTELTAYDPQSVMHYFCGGVGDRDLRFTPVDVAGSRQVYGPPLANLSFVQ